MEELLLVGRIWRPHGVRGEVKVIPEAEVPERLAGIEVLYLGRSAEQAKPYDVQRLRFQQSKKGVSAIVAFEQVDGRDEAEGLRKMQVFALEEDLPPLAEDEWYIHDLVGLDVFDEEGRQLGTLRDVMSMPAHDVFIIARSGQPDAMVPAVEEFLDEVDLAAGRIVVRPIEGLLE